MKHFRLLILSLGLALVSLPQRLGDDRFRRRDRRFRFGACRCDGACAGRQSGVTTDNKASLHSMFPKDRPRHLFVGYEKQSVPVKAGAPMHITLQEEATQMGEVVVVGYGVQKKVNLTGAVSQISGDAIADKAAPNVLASCRANCPAWSSRSRAASPARRVSPFRSAAIPRSIRFRRWC